MRPSNNLENKTPSDAYLRVQLVCKKVEADSSLEPPQKFSQDQTPLINQASLGHMHLKVHSASVAAFRILLATLPHFVWISSKSFSFFNVSHKSLSFIT